MMAKWVQGDFDLACGQMVFAPGEYGDYLRCSACSGAVECDCETKAFRFCPWCGAVLEPETADGGEDEDDE